MAALDTNVLIRFLIQDDAARLAAAKKLVRKCVNEGETLFVPVTVSLELEWVLRLNFRFEKQVGVKALSDLLSSTEMRFQCEGALEVALVQYSQASADYADCRHAALATAANSGPLWTFDKTAAKVDRAKLLTVSA